jgi:DNA-directed RNA polymerase specialized sigma24 family protein
MEAAITLPAGPTTGLFADVGGALFRRAARLLGDEATAARVAEDLFVRFVVHGNAQGMDVRERWNWIYRVVTSHCLRQLSDDAIPGISVGESGSRNDDAIPPMRALRRMDEATQNIVVLSLLDGLTPEEVAEVLGLPVERIRRRIAAKSGAAAVPDRQVGGRPSAGASGAPPRQLTHPSMLVLDRDRASQAEHVAACDRCRAIIDDGDRLMARFARDVAPAAVIRVAAAVRAERSRLPSGPRWKRLMWLGGGLALVSGLALLVARPRVPDRVGAPYAGIKGASRAKAAGIQISVARGAEVRPFEPTSAIRPGDRLYFRVRAERPRYLELRVRDAEGDSRLFPVGAGDAVVVQPGQAVGGEYLVGVQPVTARAPGQPEPGPEISQDGARAPKVSPGGAQVPRIPPDEAQESKISPGGAPAHKIWIVGLFCDHPFPLDRPPGPDVEVVPVRIDIQP